MTDVAPTISSEQFCRVGELELCYQTFGRPSDPALLLVMGLGTQMIGWHDDFCETLAGRDRFVVRFDNRDCGRSTHLDGLPVPPLRELIVRRIKQPPYLLRDMAADALGLLDHLGIESADIVGASMGGMIAQTIAVHWPERVRTLTSIMSNTGNPITGHARPRALRMLLSPAPRTKEAYVERVVRLFDVIGSPGFERDEASLRSLIETSYDRGPSPAGTARQLAAIVASGNRTKDLHRITAPTLVIHGKSDRLVAVSGGKATTRAIPGAKLMLVKGMGHDLPRQIWPQLIDAILDLSAIPDRP